MPLLDIAIATIIIVLVATLYFGYKALISAIAFWKTYGAKAEERDKNNEIYYRDFMRS